MQYDERDIFERFVDEKYVSLLNDEELETASEYTGTARVAIGALLSDSDEVDWGDERIADELNTSRRSIYSARKQLGLDVKDKRGVHVTD